MKMNSSISFHELYYVVFPCSHRVRQHQFKLSTRTMSKLNILRLLVSLFSSSYTRGNGVNLSGIKSCKLFLAFQCFLLPSSIFFLTSTYKPSGMDIHPAVLIISTLHLLRPSPPTHHFPWESRIYFEKLF